MDENKPNARKMGRPPIENGEETVPVSIRMTIPQREKLAKLGGPAWVREKIDRAKLTEK